MNSKAIPKFGSNQPSLNSCVLPANKPQRNVSTGLDHPIQRGYSIRRVKAPSVTLTKETTTNMMATENFPHVFIVEPAKTTDSLSRPITKSPICPPGFQTTRQYLLTENYLLLRSQKMILERALERAAEVFADDGSLEIQKQVKESINAILRSSFSTLFDEAVKQTETIQQIFANQNSSYNKKRNFLPHRNSITTTTTTAANTNYNYNNNNNNCNVNKNSSSIKNNADGNDDGSNLKTNIIKCNAGNLDNNNSKTNDNNTNNDDNINISKSSIFSNSNSSDNISSNIKNDANNDDYNSNLKSDIYYKINCKEDNRIKSNINTDDNNFKNSIYNKIKFYDDNNSIKSMINKNYNMKTQKANISAQSMNQNKSEEQRLLSTILAVFITIMRVKASICATSTLNTPHSKVRRNSSVRADLISNINSNDNNNNNSNNNNFNNNNNNQRGEESIKQIQNINTSSDNFICRICEEVVPLDLIEQHSALCIKAHQTLFHFYRFGEQLKTIQQQIAVQFLTAKWPGDQSTVLSVVFPVLYLFSLIGLAIETQIPDFDGLQQLEITSQGMSTCDIPDEASKLLLPLIMAARQLILKKRQCCSDIVSASIAITATTRCHRPSTIGGFHTHLSDFEIIGRLSSGAFARVYLSRKKKTGDLYAVKVIKRANIGQKNQARAVSTERDIMRRLHSPYIVNFCMFY